MMQRNSIVFIALVLLASAGPFVSAIALDEEERIEEYYRRGHTWPINATVPNTEGWRRNMLRRIAQVERVARDNKKYDAWMHVMAAAIVAPNFTEHGWGLTRAPAALVEELKESLHKGLPTAGTEGKILPIEVEKPSWFIRQPELNAKVLRELKPMHEEWSGIELVGATAYGLRAYRNNSVLFMHTDKMQTHVISCILHVDHSEDSEDWPLLIEDLDGNTNEVVLESGDMLFYESSKCIHGRPKPFNGSWYSSIFVHYYPKGWPKDRDLEVHYAVPPFWGDVKPEEPGLEKLVMSGTSLYEPDCPNRWCGTKDTVKWYGPAKEGVVITTGYKEEEDDGKEGDAEL
jgi:hypothetical protein